MYYISFLYVNGRVNRLTSFGASSKVVARSAALSANSTSRMTLDRRIVLTLTVERPPLVRNSNLTPMSMSPYTYLNNTRAMRTGAKTLPCFAQFVTQSLLDFVS